MKTAENPSGGSGAAGVGVGSAMVVVVVVGARVVDEVEGAEVVKAGTMSGAEVESTVPEQPVATASRPAAMNAVKIRNGIPSGAFAGRRTDRPPNFLDAQHHNREPERGVGSKKECNRATSVPNQRKLYFDWITKRLLHGGEELMILTRAEGTKVRRLLITLGAVVAAVVPAALHALPTQASITQYAFNNGKLRFGNGSEASINSLGNLKQPWYWSPSATTFYKLTFSSNPLDMAFGVGGDGTSNWNINGTKVSSDGSYGQLLMNNQVIDASGFTPTSSSGSLGIGYGTLVVTGDVSVGTTTLRVKHTYELGAASSFVKITTELTNDSGSAATNLRTWVGTRDDWVGTTDRPIKTRGTVDLVTGAFVRLSDKSERASALKIEAASEGVLFYSTSPGTDISVTRYGAFRNVIETNPSTTEVQTGASVGSHDGSYAMYVRMADLDAGERGSFTWYYAAGALADLDDVVEEVAGDAVPITISDPGTMQYGDSVVVTVSSQSPGNIVLSSMTTGVCDVTGGSGVSPLTATVSALASGTCEILANQASSGSYAAVSETRQISVLDKTLTITGLSVAPRDWDGTNVATVSGTPTLFGLVGTDDVALAGSLSGATFADDRAGSNREVTLSGFSLAGAQAGRYELNPVITGTVNAIAPSAIRFLALVPSNQQITATWSGPLADGGESFTYMVTVQPGGGSCSGTSVTCTFTGLDNGTQYEVTVIASNSVGSSSEVSLSATPAVVPGAPTTVSATPGDQSATVSWETPLSDGGSAILEYTVTSNPEGLTCTTVGLACRVTGLTNGVDYTFTVVAANSVGNGAISDPSDPTTPDESFAVTIPPSFTPIFAPPPSTTAPSTTVPLVVSPIGATPREGAQELVVTPQIIDQVKQGGFVTLEGDRVVETVLNEVGPGVWQLEGDDFALSLQVPESIDPVTGETRPGSSNGAVTLVRNSGVLSEGSGFSADSWVDVWLYEEPAVSAASLYSVRIQQNAPVYLGSIRVDANGEFSGELPVPGALPLGGYFLQANGESAGGNLRSMNLSVDVIEVRAFTLPVTGTNTSRVGLVAMWLVAAGLLVVAARSRRPTEV